MRDSWAAFSSSAAEGVEAVGWAFDSPAADGARCGEEEPPCDPPPTALDAPGLAEGANEVGAVFAACAAAWTASGATGAPPTCASMGEPPGFDAVASLQGSKFTGRSIIPISFVFLSFHIKESL